MAAKNKKAQRKVNILEMSNAQRIKVVEKIRKNLRQSIIEAKLLKILLQYETITINGHVVFSESNSLNGLTLRTDFL
ncbi:MAG: hypothetical protein QXK93_00850 [Candidatus Bathyarchaeia archaeon]|nr:hypothetical protein [Candidatus Bathyarchaeota archaeon]